MAIWNFYARHFWLDWKNKNYLFVDGAGKHIEQNNKRFEQ